MSVDYDKLVTAATLLLEGIGEDVGREGLVGTPDRIARMWAEFIDYDAGKVDSAFQSVQTDQMVIVRDLRVYSFCEHHAIPFWCDLSVGYLTGQRVLGLSKFARVAHKHAHKLQLQERLVHEIADEVMELTGSESVAVFAEGVHLCMTMRGIKTQGVMQTSVLRGMFQEHGTKAEFFELIGRRKPDW